MHRDLVLYFFFWCNIALFAQSENDYTQLLAKELGGQTEVSLHHARGYVDILTKHYAIEVEFANKWKNAIGQSLWYAQNMNRKAGIILVIKPNQKRYYIQQIYSTLQHSGLSDKIKIWIYPDDFQSRISDNATSLYRINIHSNTRHRKGCRWFNSNHTRPCAATEGKACGVCKG